MKQQSLQGSILPALKDHQPLRLNALAGQLIFGLLPEAIAKRSFIVNDVDPSIVIDVDRDALSYIISGLVSNAVYSTSNCCIRVQTVVKDGGLHLEVRNDGVFIYSSAMHSLGSMVDAARRLGGNISLYSEKNRGITVVLSFLDQKAA